VSESSSDLLKHLIETAEPLLYRLAAYFMLTMLALAFC